MSGYEVIQNIQHRNWQVEKSKISIFENIKKHIFKKAWCAVKITTCLPMYIKYLAVELRFVRNAVLLWNIRVNASLCENCPKNESIWKTHTTVLRTFELVDVL